MTKISRFLFGLAALAAVGGFMILPAVTPFLADHQHTIHKMATIALSFGGLFGAVTINYLYPGTVAPPAPNLTSNTVIATVSASAAADTSAVITHSFGLANSEITQGWPRTMILAQDGNEITSPWFELSQNPNYTVLGKGTTAAGGQGKVFISRDHSIVR